MSFKEYTEDQGGLRTQLVELMVERELSLIDLAYEMHVSPIALNGYMYHDKSIQYRTYKKIYEYLLDKPA